VADTQDVAAGSSGSGSAAVTTDLKQNAIGLVGSLMQAITGMGPIFAALFFTQEVVGIAGVTAPLAYLFGVIVVVMLGSTLVQFTKHMPSAGSYYTFVSRGLNARLGFLTAWMNFVYMPVVQGPIMGYFGAVLASELKANYSVNLPWLWWVAILVGAPLIAILARYGIALSVRIMVILGLAELLLVWTLGIWGLASPGRGGFNFSSFNPAHIGTASAFALAIAFSFQGMDGWEFAAPLAEETSNPRRNVPRATMIAILGLGVFLVVTYWGQVVGWGTANLAALPKSAEVPGLVLAHRYWGYGWIAVMIAFLSSTFAVSQSLNNVSTRIWYRMAAGGAAPAWLAKVHPTRRTPANAIWLQMVLSIVIGIGAGLGLGPDNSFFLIVGLVVVLAVVYIYIMGNAAVAAYYWRQRRAEFNPFLHFAIPLFTTAALIYVGVETFNPLPAYPLNLAPYIAGGWLLLGIVILLIMRARGDDRWLANAGASLGESIGEGRVDEASHPTVGG
jgi:amino acid transporter